MKPNLLYHYTSLKSFEKIWSNKLLKFSEQSNLNDINEVAKMYFEGEDGKLQKEVEKYKQISLTIDGKRKYSSCMIPSMWGHYGENGQGVCIELDITKLILPKTMLLLS